MYVIEISKGPHAGMKQKLRTINQLQTFDVGMAGDEKVSGEDGQALFHRSRVGGGENAVS